jgi:hypothetical protein
MVTTSWSPKGLSVASSLAPKGFALSIVSMAANVARSAVSMAKLRVKRNGVSSAVPSSRAPT